jgi:AbrB family looped-hinge helix DNA binding protein
MSRAAHRRDRKGYYQTTVTSKWQITIPAAIQRAWKLKAGAAVTFEVLDGDHFTIRPVRH